jgi:hypothetical protein
MVDKRATQQYEIPEGTPEYYVDAVNVETQLYGSKLLLGDLRQGEPSLTKVVVKMSPQMAKVLSLILSKHIRNYEEGIGPITLPNNLLHSLGLEEMIQ